MPFINQTGDDSQEYLADGATEEVINALGRFNTLRVIGRTATQRYKKQPPAQGEIASDLGANYLVEGSVRRAGQRVRIAAQLTEARAGTVLWTDRYDGELADLFEFQDTIARQIAGTLAASISLVEGQRRRDHPRPDQSAYDLSLQLAMKLNPMLEPNFVFDLAVCHYLVRRHEDALRIVERGQAHYSDFLMFNALAAAAAAQLGRKEQAARYVEALRPFLPLLDLDRLGSRFKDPAHHAYLREGLTLAGL